MFRKLVYGDIFSSSCNAITVTVNTVGVMGKGLALTCKKVYPTVYSDYRSKCNKNLFDIGVIRIYETSPRILLVPTKKHWRQPSQLEWIRDDLAAIVKNYSSMSITSLALAPLGCGNGGLDWKIVLPLLQESAEKMDIPVDIYAPQPAAE